MRRSKEVGFFNLEWQLFRGGQARSHRGGCRGDCPHTRRGSANRNAQFEPGSGLGIPQDATCVLQPILGKAQLTAGAKGGGQGS